MTRIENLYVVASEECAEIQQCVSKVMRFGEKNHHPSRPDTTNSFELLKEYYQLQAVMELLLEEGVLENLSADEIERIKSDKKRQVDIYAQVSEKLGQLH